jgi:hypothetical protein
MRQAARGATAKKIERRYILAHRCQSCLSVLTLIIFGVGMTHAQSAVNSSGTPSATIAKPVPVSPQKAMQSPSSGLNTGIKVHGHWTIDVLDRDGTLAKHVEFENGLTLIGAEALPAILGRTMTPGAWAIGLGYSGATGTPGPGPCSETGPDTFGLFTPNTSIFTHSSWLSIQVGGTCYLAEAVNAGGGSPAGYVGTCTAGCFPSLSVSVVTVATSVSQYVGGLTYNTYGAPQNQLQLQGTATAENDGTIDTVATFLMLCAATSGSSAISPATCATGNLTTSAASNFSFSTLGGGADAFSQLGQGSPAFGNSITGTYLNGASATSTPPAPIGVLATQVLRVTVLLSFS